MKYIIPLFPFEPFNSYHLSSYISYFHNLPPQHLQPQSHSSLLSHPQTWCYSYSPVMPHIRQMRAEPRPLRAARWARCPQLQQLCQMETIGSLWEWSLSLELGNPVTNVCTIMFKAILDGIVTRVTPNVADWWKKHAAFGDDHFHWS